MRRLILFLIVICMFAISARLERLNLLQQRYEAMERFYMLRSIEIALEVPLVGSMTWKDMLNRK